MQPGLFLPEPQRHHASVVEFLRQDKVPSGGTPRAVKGDTSPRERLHPMLEEGHEGLLL